MRNVWTIVRKELRGYFDHPTAYVLLVVFLAINCFFYFRSALLLGEASLRPMFDLLPWILLFFVPAVTMASLAEEKRLGTLELALSHPIREHELLLGKFVGNLLFVAIGLGATVLVPFTLLAAGRLDFGVVVAQYIGGLLLAGGMTAVGLFATSLTRSQITAFIIGTAVTFVLMMLGTEVVQIGLPSWLGGVAAQLGILGHFASVARGVIDLRDVVYFVALAAAFLALAYWLLLRDRLNRRGRLYGNLRVGTALVVAIAVAANLFGGYIPGRLDLTAERLYTLSGGTRGILRDLDDMVTLTLYVSGELPAQVRPLERDVSDVLRDFGRYGRGNIQVVRKHPDRSEEALEEARRLGISEVQFNVVRREELQLKQGWLGLAVQYADQSEALPFVGDTRNLEYQLATRIWRLTRTRTPKVAFVAGHGERTRADYSGFGAELARTYEVTAVDLSTEGAGLSPDLDAAIVAGPRSPLDARARQALRRYLADGGRVLYLGEGADINLRFLFASETPDSARDFTRELGVQLSGDLVYDLRSNESISMPGEVFSYIIPYPFWLRALPAADHAITRNVNSVFLPWASSLDTLLALGGRSFTPLLSTSPYAGRQTGPFQIRPDAEIPYDPAGLGSQLLAVAVEGAVPGRVVTGSGDAEAARPDSAPSDSLPPDSLANDTPAVRVVAREAYSGPPMGRAVIVGDADFLLEQFAQNAPENIIFALNAIDWLTQSDVLLSIRAKTPTPRPLVFASAFEMLFVKYLNLIGVPLALVLFGSVRLVRRRRLTRRKYGE
jgi:ABC-2 type transport system permease protein